MAREAAEEIFAVVIFTFQCQETIPNKLCMSKSIKYRCVGVLPVFVFALTANCSALEKFAPREISRYTVCKCSSSASETHFICSIEQNFSLGHDSRPLLFSFRKPEIVINPCGQAYIHYGHTHTAHRYVWTTDE